MNDRRHPYLWTLLAFIAAGIGLLALQMRHILDADHGYSRMHDGWFDPLFLHLNFLILTAAVALPPFLAVTYVCVMRDEKERRLKSEIGEERWDRLRIHEYVRMQFAPGNYVVSVLAMMVIVAFGGTILLLVKPVIPDMGPSIDGLSFKDGANILLLGALGEEFKDHAHVILHALTAIGFGFLGAYAYSIGQLVRAYFTVDLTPNTFVAASVRMIVACVLTLVFSFAFTFVLSETDMRHQTEEASVAILPVLGFFFGYFPRKALLGIERLVGRLFGSLLRERQAESRALNRVSGMNLEHAARLEREGIDNIENLALAEPLEIAIRTGFSYRQVTTWIEEAWLRAHMGDADYPKLADGCGILTRRQLQEIVERWHPRERVFEQLAATAGVDAAKIEFVYLHSQESATAPQLPSSVTPIAPRLEVRRQSSPGWQPT